MRRGELGRFVYREIVLPERLVFVVSFSNEPGGVTRHPFAANWPLEMLNTVTFETRGDKTLVTLTKVAINASDDERRVFQRGYESMKQGFGGTFDQLAAYLAKG